MIPTWRFRGHLLLGLLPWLLAAAGCSSGVDEEPQDPPEVSRVQYPAVVLAGTDTAFVSQVLRQTRGDDAVVEWEVFESTTGASRSRHSTGPIAGDEPGYEWGAGLLAADAGGRLWTAMRADGRLRICQRVPTRDDDCFTPAQGSDGSPRALAASGDGQALLLFRSPDAPAPGGAANWRGLWMSGLGDRTGYDLAGVLQAGEAPRVVYNRQGAFLFRQRGTRIAGASLDIGQGRFDIAWEWPVRAGADNWAVGHEDQVEHRVWLLHCVDPGQLVVRRLQAGVWSELPTPASATPPCSAGAQQLRLTVSAQGDALVVWSVPDANGQRRWLSQRWRDEAAAWDPAANLAHPPGLSYEPRLAADGAGRFVAVRVVTQQDQQVLQAEIQGTDGAWQTPVDLGRMGEGDGIGGPAVAATGDGRAFVAWAQPAAFGAEGSRLATAWLDLRRAHTRLDVEVVGQGSLRSAPQGIACPGACSAQFPDRSTVQIEATAAFGHGLQQWSGDAPGCAGNQATVSITLNGPARCTATFVALERPALTLAVQGGGSVTAHPAGPTYEPGTPVTLTATPAAGQRFVAWGGDADCTDGQLTMDAPRACTALFEPDPGQVQLLLSVSGGGRVQSNPAGLDCPGSCQGWFPLGQTVVLTAQPPASHAVAWGPGCAGNGAAATLVLNAGASCTVTFVPPAPNGWQELGAAPPPAGGLVGRPAIAADAQGVPTIAYTTEIADFRELYVMRLVGDAWRVLGNGPINDPLVGAFQPSLALDANGHPVVAFGTARGRVQVRRWDGNQWLHLADDLSLTPGATTSAPQLALFGDQAVVAFVESGQAARIAVMRSPLAGGAWTGALVDGVSFASGGELRLALDATGNASVAYVSGAGVGGELAPRVMHETPAGWVPLCGGDVGAASGNGYANTIVGYGLQHAADGSALLVRPRNDFLGVQAWRCDGNAWAPWGPDSGRMGTVDNLTTYLKSMAMAAAGTPTVAVQVGLGYAGGTQVHAYVAGAGGFAAVGPALDLPLPGLNGALAVTPAAAGSPAVAVGLESAARGQLRTARFHP